MFCNQCEQTAKGTGCTIVGVCGKNEDVADLQDLLVHALQGLSLYAKEGRTLGIIDEPTEGLAPKIVELVAEYLQELRKRGISVLLIEQKLTIAMKISDRCLVMGHGAIVFEGTPDQLRNNSDIRKEWLEV